MGDVAPVIVSVTLFLVIGAVMLLFFINRHRERMSMIEKGFGPEQMKARGIRFLKLESHFDSLKWGIIMVAVGLAILTGIVLDTVYGLHHMDGMYPALIFLYAGVGLIVYYILAAKKTAAVEDSKQE